MPCSHNFIDQPDSSSDAGAVLFRALDERLGLTRKVAGALVDRRSADRVRHSLRDVLRQRIYRVACGYEDANDAARLQRNPAQKLLLGRNPLSGQALASQPTLSRFENGVNAQELLGMGTAPADCVIERHRRRLRGRVKRVTIDLGGTVEYLVAMGSNAVLARLAEPLVQRAREESAASGVSERVYGHATYQARSWPHARRVVIKGEVTRYPDREPRDNPR